VLDALLHEGGSLRRGSRRMAAVLSAMMLDALGLSPGQPRKAYDDPVEADDDTAMLEMPITEVKTVEIPQTAPPLRRYARRRSALEPEAKPISVIDPKAITAERAEPAKKPPGPVPPRSRRHRPRF
jgi:hypothetical protein